MASAPRTSMLAGRLATRLVPWLRAWRAGLVPYDEVVPAVADGSIEEQVFVDLPGTWSDVPVGEGLAAFAKLHPDEIRLVLPAPGDPRGVGSGAFGGAAILAGEAVVAGDLGIIPEVTEHVSGSGDVFHTTRWLVHHLAERPRTEPDPPAEAEAALTEAIAAATRELARLDALRWRPELGNELAGLRRHGGGPGLPAGYSARCRRLFARASVLEGVLTLADSEAADNMVTVHDVTQRAAALRPLRDACRRAIMAAANAPLSA